MIIFEGPDGAGKTTLIEDIQQRFGPHPLPVAPRVVSKNAEAMLDLKQWVEENTRGGFQATIFDRHRLISEPIYGAVLRSEFQPGFDDWTWLYLQYYQLYNRVQPLIIYCLPPWETVRENVRQDWDNQPKHVREGIRKIYALYCARAASDCATVDAMFYNYKAFDAEEQQDRIFRAIRQAIEMGHR